MKKFLSIALVLLITIGSAAAAVTLRYYNKDSETYKFKVKISGSTTTVVSGIAAYFTPEEIVGRQVSILVNLAPRKMRGVESQGMILMAEDADGKLVFVAPESVVNPGSEIR